MENLKSKIQIPSDVQKILDLLDHNNYDAYIVGGCVRDCILNKVPNDWDICTNCIPEKVIDIFKSFKVIPTGLKHGTVTIVMNGENYEVTTYRIDGNYIDGRRPEEVEFTRDLKEDLKRRDFTINAMAYNNRSGLIDYYGGLDDILNKKIRCVGNPLDRFREDYLRMLRAIRFSTQLEYDLDTDTFNAIENLSQNIKHISAERIREEINKILISNIPSKGFELLNTTGMLKHILPELEKCVGFDQHNPHHDKDIFNHILNVMDHVENDLILRLSALFHDIGKAETFTLDDKGIGHFYKHNLISSEIAHKVMKRLKYDNKTIEQVVILVREHMSKLENAKDQAVRRLINRVGIDHMDGLFKLQIADRRSKAEKDRDITSILQLKNRVDKILSSKDPLFIKDLKINGQDLINLGVPEGRQIGIILKDLMKIVLKNPELNTKESLIEIVKNRFVK